MHVSIRSFIFYTCIFGVSCFLLDSGNTVRPGDNQKCLTVESFVAEKEELKHEIDILKRDMGQTLQVLTSQLNRKLKTLENKTCTSNNDISSLFDKWEERYQELENNNTKLQTEYDVLQKKYAILQQEVSNLNMLKSVQQLQDVQTMQQEIQVLQKNSALLTSKQNARTEDFIALYNMTVQQHNDINLVQQNFHSLQQTTEQLKNNQNIRNQDFMALYNRTLTSEQKTDDLKITMTDRFKNDTKHFENLFSQMRILDSKIIYNGEKVAFSACGNNKDLSIPAGGPIKFQQIRTKIGINNIASFILTGKFTCESAGLYYISAHIRSDTDSFTYFIMENNSAILESAGTAHISGVDSTSPITAIVDVQKNDVLYIKAGVNSRVFADKRNKHQQTNIEATDRRDCPDNARSNIIVTKMTQEEGNGDIRHSSTSCVCEPSKNVEYCRVLWKGQQHGLLKNDTRSTAS